jgi:hypothetical protein
MEEEVSADLIASVGRASEGWTEEAAVEAVVFPPELEEVAILKLADRIG